MKRFDGTIGAPRRFLSSATTAGDRHATAWLDNGRVKPFWRRPGWLRYPFQMQRKSLGRRRPWPARAGQTLDYVLMATALLPLVAMALPQTRKIIGLVFELSCDLIAMPFM